MNETDDQTVRMIETLRTEFSRIHLMDPYGPDYERLKTILDEADNKALIALYKAKIRWVSPFAFNRMVKRKIVS